MIQSEPQMCCCAAAFFSACRILGIILLPNMLVSSLGHQSLTQHGGMSCHVMSCHVMLVHTIFWRGDRFFYCTGASHAVLHHHVSLRNILCQNPLKKRISNLFKNEDTEVKKSPTPRLPREAKPRRPKVCCTVCRTSDPGWRLQYD